jgi:hypothetical protein
MLLPKIKSQQSVIRKTDLTDIPSIYHLSKIGD